MEEDCSYTEAILLRVIDLLIKLVESQEKAIRAIDQTNQIQDMNKKKEDL